MTPAIEITGAKTGGTAIDRFCACQGQAWCILGAIHSGIQDFFSLITKDMPDARFDSLALPKKMGVVSFKKQQAVYESELKKDDTDFMDKVDPGTPARAFIVNAGKHAGLIRSFGMAECLDHGYRELSTGQSRKLMLLSEFSKHPACLIIETPFDGLDQAGCQELAHALKHLYKTGVLLILFVHNQSDIPAFCTHLGVMSEGRLAFQGLKKEGEQWLLDHCLMETGADFKACLKDIKTKSSFQNPPGRETSLIDLKNGCAGYGGKPVFQNLNLTIDPGRHTLITGPNGSGKSTLLQMITGDHPSCYTNDLKIFGIPRGSGESVWDLKKDMGIVSSDLHRNYRVPGSALSCIISGYFDSIGVYRHPTPIQKDEAMKWLDRISLGSKGQTAFRDLSYGDQRLVLIARALVKLPRLLVLDEPTQGLDDSNRKALLDFIEDVAAENICTILYVSHREDEFRRFFAQHIRMASAGLSEKKIF